MTQGNVGALEIRVSAGRGIGLTRLSAFDAALRDAGVADFNLVRLSSVIPPRGVIREVQGSEQLQGRIGDVLYCVYADSYASTPGEEAWAGVAWAQRAEVEPAPGDETENQLSGSGVFVEHSGISQALVERDLRASLADLTRNRVGDFPHQGRMLSSARCVDHPVCAIVVASYSIQTLTQP
ncbi:pyruvoyl-dependent arginine decarboxylase [Microlunatus parietis]|uniref:Pyruvoyl-dependent arginine decarboxylase AaxB n=1 Tax=Microlunatus parietis TaxID=682979 RepID=A0A7Y9LAF3_9ACTN|nr:pyruvoyl-dependent arginine decarboxylase [Microlunatus parietis]NYE70622.1 arginine decarboxylase [Microlunatus parietis]